MTKPTPQEIEAAVRVVAEFDGWKRDKRFDYKMGDEVANFWEKDGRLIRNLPPYATDRDSIIQVALKLPEEWQQKWAVKVYRMLGCDYHSVRTRVYRDLLTAPAEILLVALSQVITEMNKEKGEG